MSRFSEILDLVLEDISGQQSSSEIDQLSNQYLGVVQKIDSVKAQLEDLYNEMVTIEKKTLATLATSVKSVEPNIDINLSSGNLSVGDNDGCCDVAPINGKFVVQGTGFSGDPREVLRHLLSVVVPEHSKGRGRLIVEGKKVPLVALYSYKDEA
jgi:hypothetical protein